jgi:hypothetical protein
MLRGTGDSSQQHAGDKRQRHAAEDDPAQSSDDAQDREAQDAGDKRQRHAAQDKASESSDDAQDCEAQVPRTHPVTRKWLREHARAQFDLLSELIASHSVLGKIAPGAAFFSCTDSSLEDILRSGTPASGGVRELYYEPRTAFGAGEFLQHHVRKLMAEELALAAELQELAEVPRTDSDNDEVVFAIDRIEGKLASIGEALSKLPLQFLGW